MQRILQINIAGRLLPIEEDAYVLLKDYITALERQFTGEEGKEIISDIESRIAELFAIRLQSGSPAIDRADVQKVKDTLGAPNDFDSNATASGSFGQQNKYSGQNQYGYGQTGYNRSNGRRYGQNNDRLLRDPFNKMLGGVCSGVAHYFDIDPVFIRLVMVVLFLTFGIGLVAYIIAWVVIPAARTRQELSYGNPMTFHDISSNVASELQDLKLKGEQMSRDLKDFFSKKR